MSEAWSTVLFLLVVPVVVQIYKIVREKMGAEVALSTIRWLALLGGAGFYLVGGQFVGIAWPLFPVYADVFSFVLPFLTWVANVAGLLVVMASAVMGLYTFILKAFLEAIGLATQKALALRK